MSVERTECPLLTVVPDWTQEEVAFWDKAYLAVASRGNSTYACAEFCTQAVLDRRAVFAPSAAKKRIRVRCGARIIGKAGLEWCSLDDGHTGEHVP